MKNIIYKIQGLTALIALVSLMLIASCNEDDSTGNQVELFSFGPGGVIHGDKISFIGQNLNKVTSIVFEPGVEVPSSSFIDASSSSFKVIVPEAVEAGYVTLNYEGGAITTKTIMNLMVDVVISDVTDEAKPGTNITITGEKLNWIEQITFARDLVVKKDQFVSRTENELVVQVPWAAQSGFLKFQTNGTNGSTFDSEEQLIVFLPEGTAAPASVKHDNPLTITGTNLDLVEQLLFPGDISVAKGQFESQSETQIVVKVPVTSLSGKVTMVAPSGEVTETNAITIILPDATAFNPSNTANHVGGSSLTITGTDLDLVAKIIFPNAASPVTTFVSQSSTQIVVTIPDDATGGTVYMITTHGFTVPISLPFGDQLTLLTVFYDDATQNGFGAWGGYGSTTNWESTEQIRIGSKAIKADFSGTTSSYNGAAQFGGGNVSTAGTSFFAFSVYGGAGTDGKKLQLLIKDNSGNQSTKEVIIAEGKWTDFKVPLSDLGNPAVITELFFQNADFNAIVYIDQVGLK